MYKIILCCLLMIHQADAQEMRFKWSEKVSTKGILNYCGDSGQHIFTAQVQSAETVLLRQFDRFLQLTQEDTLHLENRNQEYLTSFLTDSHFVHVVALKEAKKQTTILLVKTSIRNPRQSTTTVAAELKGGYLGVVYTFHSRDKSRLLVANFNLVARTSTIERDFVVINTHSGNVQFSGRSAIQGFNDHIGVTNSGMVWFSAEQISSKQIRLIEKTKTQQQVLFITPDLKEKSIFIRFDGKYTTGVNLIESNANELYAAGFAYSNDPQAGNLSASDLFIYKVDAEKGTVTDSAFVTVPGLFRDGKLKQDEKIPYTIRHIYKRENGGYTILAEQYQFIAGQYSGTQKYYDIGCIRLDKMFRLESVTRIPKRQYGTDNPSFISIPFNDTLYLVYNDLAENALSAGEPVNYPSSRQNKNGLVSIRIDKKGEYQKHLLFNYASGEPMPQIRLCTLYNGKTVFLPAEGQIGILTLRE